MSDYAVSLIICAFNEEENIKKCLDSAVAQTIDKLEIVIVDDHSTDDTAAIIQQYIVQHDNILFLQNEANRGVGYSRNLALQKAHGEYVSFLDADDYIPQDYLKNMYHALQSSGMSIAAADLVLKYNSSEKNCQLNVNNLYLAMTGLSIANTKSPSVILALPVIASSVGASACTKLVKRKLWLKFPFYEGKRCDDLPSVFPMLAAERKVCYVPQCKYYYYQSGNSLERSKSLNLTIAGFQAVFETLSIFRDLQVEPECSQLLACTSAFSLLTEILDFVAQADAGQFLKEFFCELQQNGFIPLLDKTANPFLKDLSASHLSPKARMLECLLPLLCAGNVDEFIKQAGEGSRFNCDVYPKVSIIIPVYNGSNYLRDAIDSALAQTYPNIEVIVINDGSRDEGATEKIALSYGDKIRYYSKENGGVATALNVGIKKMYGEYFAWLSHDDMYKPEKIEKEIELVLNSKNRHTVVAGGYDVVNSNGEYLYSNNISALYPQKRISNPLFTVLRGGINGCAMLIHKSHFDRVGMFDENLPSTQDYDLWFRMFQNCPFIYYKDNYVLSRSHEEQNSRTMENHLRDCNKLWIWMMQETSPQKRLEISGSDVAFFEEMYTFLSSATNYTEAISYAKEQEERARAIQKEPKQCSLIMEQEEREYQRRIAEMLQSKSWRITAPLRMMKKPLAKIGIEKESLFESDTVSAKQKWEAMQNSRSWRYTNSLRQIKKGALFLRKNGFWKTVEKVGSKMSQRSNKRRH